MRQPIILLPRNKKVVKQLIELQVNRDDFQEETKRFREKYEIEELSEKTKSRFLTHKKNDFHVWESDLYMMLQRLSLPPQWKLTVFDYLTTGKYSADADPEGITFFKDITDCPAYTQEDWLIGIHPSTTRQDLIDAWDDIEKYFKGKKTKAPSSKNFERDEYIYNLRVEKNLTYAKIRTLVSENYRDYLDDSHMRSIVDKQKKKIQKHRTSYLKK
jgi:hypothetical protein